jgi:hypothetical protein
MLDGQSRMSAGTHRVAIVDRCYSIGAQLRAGLALGETPLLTRAQADLAGGDIAALAEVGLSQLGRGLSGREDQCNGFEEHCRGAGRQSARKWGN